MIPLESTGIEQSVRFSIDSDAKRTDSKNSVKSSNHKQSSKTLQNESNIDDVAPMGNKMLQYESNVNDVAPARLSEFHISETTEEEVQLMDNKLISLQLVWGYQKWMMDVFYRYGYNLARQPIIFLVVPLLICVSFSCFVLYIEPETDLETLYAPMFSRSFYQRQHVVSTFPDRSGSYYSFFSLSVTDLYAVVIFRSLKPQAILEEEVIEELRNFTASVSNITTVSKNKIYTYSDVCARLPTGCVVDSAIFFTPFFMMMFHKRFISYPIWEQAPFVDMSLYLGDAATNSENMLISAGSIKIKFPLRHDTPQLTAASRAWELEFIKFMNGSQFSTVQCAYSVSHSINEEMNIDIWDHTFYFIIAFASVVGFCAVVNSGGDCVSTRVLAVVVGVIGVVSGIFGALGFLTLCGITFVHIVCGVPYILLGFGVDSMLVLLSCLNETFASPNLTLPQRMGLVFKKAGVTTTHASVTALLAFVAGLTCRFKSVDNFCIYSGAAVIFCFLCNITIFGACLALHNQRVYASRHALTCHTVTKSRQQLRQEGGSCLYSLLCGGQIPEASHQSICERTTRMALAQLARWKPFQVVILLVFAGYLGVSIWGCTKLTVGLNLEDLISKQSYLYRYQTWDFEDYGLRLPISFININMEEFWKHKTYKEVINMLMTAKEDPLVESRLDHCWYISYLHSPVFNISTHESFISSVQVFLSDYQPVFYNDVVFGPNNGTIVATRCQVLSVKINSRSEEIRLMHSMRKLADMSATRMFAYHSSFVFLEMYFAVLPDFYNMLIVIISIMFLAVSIFLPYPRLVLVLMILVCMIIVGICGLMALIWGLELNPVTMIHILMGVGFSVGSCFFVSMSYLTSPKDSRVERAVEAMLDTSTPLFLGSLSSLLAVLVLFFSNSYIFSSFAKLMFLVIFLGVAHAVLLTPVLLSYLGPRASLRSSKELVLPELTSG